VSPASRAADSAGPFSAVIDLDLARLEARLGRRRVVAEIVVLLVEACRAAGLIDDESPLRIARPSGTTLLGVHLGQAVQQSTYAIDAALDPLTDPLPAPVPGALTMLDLGATPVRTSGDWGLGGVGVVTFGPAVPTAISHAEPDGSGLSLAHRRLTSLGFVVPDASAHAHGVVRALDRVARSVEQMNR
jgi:hypothetical protein